MFEFLANSYVILGISIVAAIVVMIALEAKREGLATTAISVALAVLLWNYGQDLWSFVTTNLTTTILFVVGYLIVGVVWSFLKWNEFVKKIFNIFREVKEKFVYAEKDFSAHDVMVSFCGELKDKGLQITYATSLNGALERITPKGVDNKARIVSWISYWPLSLIATLLNNPFRRLFNYVYGLVSGLYDVITAKHAKGLAD